MYFTYNLQCGFPSSGRFQGSVSIQNSLSAHTTSSIQSCSPNSREEPGPCRSYILTKYSWLCKLKPVYWGQNRHRVMGVVQNSPKVFPCPQGTEARAEFSHWPLLWQVHRFSNGTWKRASGNSLAEPELEPASSHLQSPRLWERLLPGAWLCSGPGNTRPLSRPFSVYPKGGLTCIFYYSQTDIFIELFTQKPFHLAVLVLVCYNHPAGRAVQCKTERSHIPLSWVLP